MRDNVWRAHRPNFCIPPPNNGEQPVGSAQIVRANQGLFLFSALHAPKRTWTALCIDIQTDCTWCHSTSFSSVGAVSALNAGSLCQFILDSFSHFAGIFLVSPNANVQYVVLFFPRIHSASNAHQEDQKRSQIRQTLLRCLWWPTVRYYNLFLE